MLQETKELLKGFYGLDDETFKLSEEVMNDIKHKFDEIKEIREYNQYKVLKAMQEANLSDNHFNWTTGYGYNDLGREKDMRTGWSMKSPISAKSMILSSSLRISCSERPRIYPFK